MSRFALALCALLVAMTPRVVSSSPALADNFQRPEAHRHTINAILGDLSFIHHYGIPPPPGTDADLRVRTHLEFVHALLSRRDTSHLPAELREARRQNLSRLREYIDAGRFPRNQLYPNENHPCFIDRDERICAVGYLVERSAGREIAERINTEFQSEFLWRMRLPALERWGAGSGLSLLELSMIQPQYAPVFYVNVTQDSDRAPTRIAVTGYVLDEGFSCGIKFVVFNFGDGAVWTSPQVNGIFVPVDIEHVYTRPGVHTITGVAVSVDWCGNQTGTKTWNITLASPAFTLAAVRMPGGPPYGVYLSTTDDIRLDYLSEATVTWDDGGPPGAAGWYADGSSYRTPVYTYAAGGHRNIAVTHRYGGPLDTFSEVGSVGVEVGGSLTEPSTWGHIKALYASDS